MIRNKKFGCNNRVLFLEQVSGQLKESLVLAATMLVTTDIHSTYKGVFSVG